MNKDTRNFIVGIAQVIFFAWAALLRFQNIKTDDFVSVDTVLMILFLYCMFKGMDRIEGTL